MSASERLTGGSLRLVDSPIRVMRLWAANPACRRWSMVPVLIHVLAVWGVRLVTAPDGVAGGFSLVALAVSIMAVVGFVAFTLHAAAVVVLGMVGTGSGDSVTNARLVGLAGLAYWTQVAWSVPVLAVLLVFSADALGAPGPHGTFPTLIGSLQQLFGLWLVGLHAVALRVVSRFSVGGTWAAGIALGALFVGTPLAMSAMRPWL